MNMICHSEVLDKRIYLTQRASTGWPIRQGTGLVAMRGKAGKGVWVGSCRALAHVKEFCRQGSGVEGWRELATALT